ncbi:MAG: twin-arginine translocase TatA/TatE family subunit [Actinomycetota bacterium]
MPNVGWGELLLILLVALIVFGPKKLPEMMRSVGQSLRAFQQESGRAMDELRIATDPVLPTEHGVIDRPDADGNPDSPVAEHPAHEDT